MNKIKNTFDKLCRYIWQDNPDQFIAVRVNSVATSEGEQTYIFSAPRHNYLTGTVSITETGLIELGKGLGYDKIRIIVQRGNNGKYIVPDPDQLEKDKIDDY